MWCRQQSSARIAEFVHAFIYFWGQILAPDMRHIHVVLRCDCAARVAPGNSECGWSMGKGTRQRANLISI